MVPITDAMIAVSDAVGRRVSARVGVDFRNIDVIGNGVDISRFAHSDADVGRRLLGTESGQFCIGLVGRVCHQKGIDLFVQAAIRMANRHPQFRFVIVGDIEDQALHAKLQTSIVSAGLENVIRFVGHINDAAPVFAALDLLVAPSRWEGFGLILVEAMAAGVPIVASRIDAIQEVTGDGRAARLIAVNDVDALENGMGSVATDSNLRDRLVRAGRDRAEDFSWQRSADAACNVYDRITMTHQ